MIGHEQKPPLPCGRPIGCRLRMNQRPRDDYTEGGLPLITGYRRQVKQRFAVLAAVAADRGYRLRGAHLATSRRQVCTAGQARLVPCVLTISQVTKAFGGRTLFTDASLQVNRGDRIGLSVRMGRASQRSFPHPRRSLPDEAKSRSNARRPSASSRRTRAHRRRQCWS
jgi:hypothetical protein